MSYTNKNGEEVWSLTDHVLLVLKQNRDSQLESVPGNSWLTAENIAFHIAHNVHGRPQDVGIYGKPIQAKSVKAVMGAVRELADQERLVIVAKRKSIGENGHTLKGWKIDGWRIATKEDAQEIQRDIEIHYSKEIGHHRSRTKLTDTATQKGIIKGSKEQHSLEE